jgi:hypothetical protein
MSMAQKFVVREPQRKGPGDQAAEVCIMVWWPEK